MKGGEGVSELVPGLYDELINELSAQRLEGLEGAAFAGDTRRRRPG